MNTILWELGENGHSGVLISDLLSRRLRVGSSHPPRPPGVLILLKSEDHYPARVVPPLDQWRTILAQ